MSPEVVDPDRVPSEVSDRLTAVASDITNELGGEVEPWYHDGSYWMLTTDTGDIQRYVQVSIEEDAGRWSFFIQPTVLQRSEGRVTASLSPELTEEMSSEIFLDDSEVWEKSRANLRKTFEFVKNFPIERLRLLPARNLSG